MGLFSSKQESFKLGHDPFLLRHISSDLPKETEVLVIKIVSARNLSPSTLNQYSLPNPFVEITLKPADQHLGSQTQRTSYKPSTHDPLWQPPETFQFASTREGASVMFIVYSWRGLSNVASMTSCVLTEDENQARIPLGSTTLSLKDVKAGIVNNMTLQLVNTDNGCSSGGQLNIRVEKMGVNRAISYREDVIYEYERWQPVLDWGNDYPGHLLPTDPGRWSSCNGSKFADFFDELVAPLPPDWSVLTPFCVLGNGGGWEYAVDFSCTDWYSEMTPHTYVRRRVWSREIADTRVYTRFGTDNTSMLSPRLVRVGGHSDSEDDDTSASEQSKHDLVRPTQTTDKRSARDRGEGGIVSLPALLYDGERVSLLVAASPGVIQRAVKGGTRNGVFCTADASYGEEIVMLSLAAGESDTSNLLRRAAELLFSEGMDTLETTESDDSSQDWSNGFEVASISLSDLTSEELEGKLEPFVTLKYSWSDTTVKTPVAEGAGSSAQWDKLALSTSLAEGRGGGSVCGGKVKVRVLDKEKLIGKTTIELRECGFVPGEWKDLNGHLLDIHSRCTGSYRIRCRLTPQLRTEGVVVRNDVRKEQEVIDVESIVLPGSVVPVDNTRQLESVAKAHNLILEKSSGSGKWAAGAWTLRCRGPPGDAPGVRSALLVKAAREVAIEKGRAESGGHVSGRMEGGRGSTLEPPEPTRTSPLKVVV